MIELPLKLGGSCRQTEMIPSAWSKCKLPSQLYLRVIILLKAASAVPSPICFCTWKMGLHEPWHRVVFIVLWNSHMKGFRQNRSTDIYEHYMLLSQSLCSLEFQLGNKITPERDNCQLTTQLRKRQGWRLVPLLSLRQWPQLHLPEAQGASDCRLLSAASSRWLVARWLVQVSCGECHRHFYQKNLLCTLGKVKFLEHVMFLYFVFK